MESIYGDRLPELEGVMDFIIGELDKIRKVIGEINGEDPVEHCLCRIKSEESMREKCRRKGVPETADSALNIMHDAIGIRVVCSFIDDVYGIRDEILKNPDFQIVEEKDYIRHSKPNGYRSYHMIVSVRGFFAEIQLRTISMDTWAALEHQMKYKKQIGGMEALISAELKRCADELASTDISMQTIRNMIMSEK